MYKKSTYFMNNLKSRTRAKQRKRNKKTKHAKLKRNFMIKLKEASMLHCVFQNTIENELFVDVVTNALRKVFDVMKMGFITIYCDEHTFLLFQLSNIYIFLSLSNTT